MRSTGAFPELIEQAKREEYLKLRRLKKIKNDKKLMFKPKSKSDFSIMHSLCEGCTKAKKCHISTNLLAGSGERNIISTQNIVFCIEHTELNIDFCLKEAEEELKKNESN